MSIKVENQSTQKLPKDIEQLVENILGVVPGEHKRGLSRLVFVDQIKLDSRLSGYAEQAQNLPALYHPKQGGSQPWLEVAAGVLLMANESWAKRYAAKAAFKANLASSVYSLVAQHYHFTLSHGIKKNQYEGKIRAYVEKYHQTWRESQNDWRAKLFNPLRPYIERIAKWLNKKVQAEQKRAS
ncbi:MAG: hypothetical protein HOP19_18510 [Acidobacteria bacterium]|nr:hypothetical protein [Acidobacteriota bacterium]